MEFWHYPNCSTCVKARKLLEQELGSLEEVTLHDLVKTPPSVVQLKKMHGNSAKPLKALFNTAGQSYRNGGFNDRLESMSDNDKFAALAADGKLIKRPLLEIGSQTLIGFREEEWKAALANR